MLEMDKIASFTVDHTTLMPGMYISRMDGDVTTYDMRFCRPNHPPFLQSPAMHTIEHIFATLMRNSAIREQVIYFGPMGCRTGFYLLIRNSDHAETLGTVRDCLAAAAEWQGEIPGASAEECGNYLEHDLDGAKKYLRDYLNIIKDWTAEMLDY